jgi:serine/threonine protein kinase
VYELLTGKPPFFRGNILAQLMQEEPVPMTRRREEFGVMDIAPIPSAWEKTVAACLAKEPADRPQSGAAILALLKNPERSLVLQSRPTIDPSKLAIVPREPLQPAPATDTVVAQTAEFVSLKSEYREVRDSEPSRVLAFFSAILSGTVEIIGAIVRPIFKILLVLGAIWGFLHLKGKWDTLEAKRSSESAKLRKAQQAAEADVPAPRPQQQPFMQPAPAPFQPLPGPPPGMGQGAPPPFVPPPPPPRR